MTPLSSLRWRQDAPTIAVWNWMLGCAVAWFPHAASAPHFLPLWCQVVIPTLSQATIRELWFLFKRSTEMTQQNHGFVVILTRLSSICTIYSVQWLKADTKELWKPQQATITTKQEPRPQHGNTTQLGLECTSRVCDILSNRAVLVFCATKENILWYVRGYLGYVKG